MKYLSHLSASLALVALVTTGATAAAPTEQIATPVFASPGDFVAHHELVASGRTDLFEYVRLHRPQWLRTRGVSASGVNEVMVYVNGNRMGGPRTLEHIRPDMAVEVRYLDSREATTLYGAGHGAGAILVTTGPVPIERNRRVPDLPRG